MEKILSEITGIESVGALREALADVPDDMTIGDAFGEPIKLEFLQDEDGEKSIAVW